jgi:imidazolonepropionase-like amidohydrolase
MTRMNIGFYNARLITMEETEGEIPLSTGWIVIAEGKIKDVGYGNSLPGYCDQVVDLEGKVITPGLIDAHSHIGLYEEGNAKEGDDINETSNPATPHLRAIDGISPRDIGFKAARESGITCVCCLPGSANVIGGLGSVLKTTDNLVDKMVLSANCCLKVAFGENPKRVYGEKRENPVTRMAIAGLLREKLVQAGEWQRENKDSPKRDLQQQVFVDVLEGRLPIRVHAHRADDVMTGIRIAREFGINMVLEHCMEGHFIAEEIAEANIPVVYGPMLLGRVKQELREMDEGTPAALMRAGVKVALTTDHPEISIRHLSLCAAVAAREGMGKMEALKAITINPAEILGVASRVGSLAPGKDADFVVWSGSPFELLSKVESVYIDGQSVYGSSETS